MKTKKQIKGYIVEAHFVNDSTIDGDATYYDAFEDKIESRIHFVNGVKHGAAINYFKNGNIKDSVSFFNGVMNGFHILYDSSQNILYKDFYYYGQRLGPKYRYQNGNLHQYVFTNFEKEELYFSEYDSGVFKKGQGEIMVNNIYELTIDDSLHYGLFVYFINPPSANTTYSLGLISKNEKDKRVLLNYSNDRIFIDTVLKLPPINFDYYISCDYLNTATKENKYFIDILKYDQN